MGKDAKAKESKGKGKQAASGSDENASKGKGKGGKAADGLGTCTYVKGTKFSPISQAMKHGHSRIRRVPGSVMCCV